VRVPCAEGVPRTTHAVTHGVHEYSQGSSWGTRVLTGTHGTHGVACLVAAGAAATAAPTFAPSLGEVVNPAESARSYSSVWDNSAVGNGFARSMLDSALCWSALTNTVSQYMTISLGSVRTVTGVVTQGRADYSQWVTSYKVQTSTDCSMYSDVDGGQVFSGNLDRSSKAPNVFRTAVQASCVRLLPQSWVVHISMRAGVQVLPTTAAPSALSQLAPQHRCICAHAQHTQYRAYGTRHPAPMGLQPRPSHAGARLQMWAPLARTASPARMALPAGAWLPKPASR
jgi:hypothetical protein